MSSVTIKDIARALNISVSTVSRALRDSYDINAGTKKRVVEYAEKMNYRPNPIALSLKENKSRSIGVIVPEIANTFFSQAINGIEEIACERGYPVVIFQSHELLEREIANIRHLFERRVDGLLISLSGSHKDISHLEEYRRNNFPIVYFDRVPETAEAHKVVADNFEGAFKATEHLIIRGKKRIAHITSPPTLSITQERMAGYKSALQKHGLPVREELIRYCGFRPEEAAEAICSLLETERPDAFFMGSDRLALDCFEAYKKQAQGRPEDITLVGFTNLSVAHLLEPPLSTVVQPAISIGRKAAEILLDEIENKRRGKGFETVVLGTELNIRP
ncbi:MAG: LacI family DNA-binding transcriptional regulator [Leadbetterella sp.]|nr:LacI family DNA-binding transcriptional regulator [Leadbetterella sp.]